MKEKLKIKHPLVETYIAGIVTFITILMWLFVQNFFLFVLAFFYLLMVSFAHWYVRKVSQIYCEITQQHERLFIDETGHCRVRIINPTKLPIFEVAFRFRSDEHMKWTLLQGELEQSIYSYRIPLQLKKQETLEIDLHVSAQQRGLHNWQEAEIILSDPFRLITIHIPISKRQMPCFRIYPRIAKVNIPETNSWKHGFRTAAVSPLYDETKIIGVKAYEQESFRSIHWGATAKTGVLSAKKYEYTQGDRYAVYLNVLGSTGYTLRPDIEYLIEVTAGVCRQLLAQDCSFELWVNSMCENGIVHITSGKYRKQLHKTLQLLSSLTDRDVPLSSSYFYQTGFRLKEVGAIPIIIGNPPEKHGGWLQVVK
ncbi:DUF58 domain-containing protein [Bacillus rhizoplanae]|uniref:DUF58 domain-containing protein n=1 Tax=Bacillus rhizoplanae TaxID=2880966 RepID=UPI003D25EBDA